MKKILFNVLIFITLVLKAEDLILLELQKQGLTLEDINQSVVTSTNQTSSFWNNFFTQYLKIDPATGESIADARLDINSALYQEIYAQKRAADDSAIQDTNQIISKTLANRMKMSSFINETNGDLNDIAPLGSYFSPKNQSLNANSLIGQDRIPLLNSSNKETEVALNAKNFILLLSGAIAPIEVKSQSRTDLDDKEYADYLNEIWSSNSQKSVALSILYNMLRKREPIAILGQTSNIKDENGNNISSASIVEIEKYLANKRLADPNWIETIKTAPMIRLQREAVIILAEIQRAMHNQSEQSDKINLALATIISQNIQLKQTMSAITNSADEAAKKAAIYS